MIEYEQRLITDMKTNPNRCSLKTKSGVSNVDDGNGNLTETKEETAIALNTYYHSVFTYDPQCPPPVFPVQMQEKLSDVMFTKQSVEEVLEVNPNKAAGPHRIETRILKEYAKELAPILCKIYRKSIDESEVPARWKEWFKSINGQF